MWPTAPAWVSITGVSSFQHAENAACPAARVQSMLATAGQVGMQPYGICRNVRVTFKQIGSGSRAAPSPRAVAGLAHLRYVLPVRGLFAVASMG